MEKQVNGIIQEIFLGEAKEDNYGKRSALCSITVNNEKYSCFAYEYNGRVVIQTKMDDVYVDLKKGMQVVFKASQKGQYWNFKPLSVIILKMADSGAQNTQATNYTTQEEKVPHNASDGITKEDLVSGVCVGFASSVVLYHLNGNIPSDIEERLQKLVGELKTKYFKL